MQQTSSGAAAQTVNAWLMNLSGEGAPLRLDDLGQCQLGDGTGNFCTVHVPEGGDEVICYVDLMRLVRPLGAAFYEEILAMNMYGEYTRGAAISFDRQQNTLILFYRRPVAQLEATTFGNVVQGFLTTSGVVRQRLQEIAAEKAPEGAAMPQQVLAPETMTMLRA